MPRIVSQLAERLELLSSSLLDLVVVGPHRPVSQFRREPLVNGLYVVHAPHGAILLSGLMLDSDDTTLQGSRADRVDALGSGGFATTYRVVDLGTEDLTRQLGRIVFDLFGGAFPFSQEAPSLPEGDLRKAEVTDASDVGASAPTFRKRGRAAKSGPAVDVAIQEQPVEPASSATEPAPKKRGRPAKKGTVVPAEVPSSVVSPVLDSGERPDAAALVAGASDTISPTAASVDSGNGDVATASPSEVVDAESHQTSGPDNDSGEPQLIMTKNQRREKRRRELAQIRGTEP